MDGKTVRFVLEGRSCACFKPEGSFERLPAVFLCGWGMEEKLPVLARDLPPLLLFSAEADGGRDFTPWPVPAVWEGEEFTGEAAGYLRFLTEDARPFLIRRFGMDPRPERSALLGYSLGGLFALWAMGQTGAFGLFGSLSGSVWYEGFSEYLRAHPPRGTERVYLSLGDREEFGGPPRMRAVGGRTREAAAFYRDRLSDAVLEWNRGGHGKGVESRWKKALRWAASRLEEGWTEQEAQK